MENLINDPVGYVPSWLFESLPDYKAKKYLGKNRKFNGLQPKHPELTLF